MVGGVTATGGRSSPAALPHAEHRQQSAAAKFVWHRRFPSACASPPQPTAYCSWHPSPLITADRCKRVSVICCEHWHFPCGRDRAEVGDVHSTDGVTAGDVPAQHFDRDAVRADRGIAAGVGVTAALGGLRKAHSSKLNTRHLGRKAGRRDLPTALQPVVSCSLLGETDGPSSQRESECNRHIEWNSPVGGIVPSPASTTGFRQLPARAVTRVPAPVLTLDHGH